MREAAGVRAKGARAREKEGMLDSYLKAKRRKQFPTFSITCLMDLLDLHTPLGAVLTRHKAATATVPRGTVVP